MKGSYRTVGVRFREINCIDLYPIRELKAFISKISVTTQAEFSTSINKHFSDHGPPPERLINVPLIAFFICSSMVFLTSLGASVGSTSSMRSSSSVAGFTFSFVTSLPMITGITVTPLFTSVRAFLCKKQTNKQTIKQITSARSTLHCTKRRYTIVCSLGKRERLSRTKAVNKGIC